ncbi:MAG: FtsX-like permease family protein [Treponemataceae bacterium]|nr:FtsX-like permease family protein [Treponemataceae bacterium]
MTTLDVRLAARNVTRQGLRSGMPILVIALSVYVIVLVGGLYQYLFDSLEQTVIRNEGHIVVTIQKETNEKISALGQIIQNLRQEIERIPGVTIVSLRSPIAGVVGYGDKSSLFSGRAIEYEKERSMKEWTDTKQRGKVFSLGQLFQSPKEMQKKNYTVSPQKNTPLETGAQIGTALAKALGISEGAWINGITGYESFAAPVEKLVTTESEEQDRFYLSLPYDALGGIDYSTVKTIHIQLSDSSFLSLVQEQLQALFKKIPFPLSFTAYNSPEGYVASVRTIYGDNLRFIIVVLSVTIFFSIAVVFTLSLSERAQELGTMRSFGMQKKQVQIIFQFEALCMSLYGYGIGLFAALCTAYGIHHSGGVKLPPPPTVSQPIVVAFTFSFQYCMIAFFLVILVAQLSAIVVGQRLGKLSVIEQLTITG